jgi:hypothetical protein
MLNMKGGGEECFGEEFAAEIGNLVLEEVENCDLVVGD